MSSVDARVDVPRQRCPALPIKGLLLGILTLCLCVNSSFLTFAGDTDFSTVDAATLAQQHSEARKMLEGLKDGNEQNVEWLWRMARAEHNLGLTYSPTDPRLGEAMSLAFEYATRAVAADANSGSAHTWYAITVGQVGQLKGGEAAIKASYEISQHARRAIELDPSNPVNYHIMGRWHYAMAELGWTKRTLARIAYSALPHASFEEAEVYLQKAVQLDPQAVRHYLWLAKTQLQLGKKADALTTLQKGTALKPRNKLEEGELAEAKRLLETL